MADGIPEQAHAELVAAYGSLQQRAVVQTAAAVARLWRLLDGSDLSRSWLAGVGAALLRAVTAGQILAVTPADAYVRALMAADGLAEPDLVAGRINPRAWGGWAADGRPLDSLLYQPVIRTKTLIRGGMTLQESMTAGLLDLQRIAVSEVADAGRSGLGAAMAADRRVVGYVRVVRPGACARCAILAGRWYRWNADFKRHKRCQCYGVPASEERRGRMVNPQRFFEGLSRAEQNRRFTAAGAQAIRDGADIFAVVNARRGIYRVEAYGRQVSATHEGATRRSTFYRQMLRETEARTGQRFGTSRADIEQGLPIFRLRTPRLLPEEIYRIADGRADVIRLLRRFAYLT
ncbi:hypothetical protein AB0K09_00495 [Streptomyces sp. NPDC049577]|uniref:VG15 protein n=1 Tax=Streptomyces sp. NPDC049577 TaxID=3155153 RepID=UPI0034357095